jgi:hypothetical protein
MKYLATKCVIAIRRSALLSVTVLGISSCSGQPPLPDLNGACPPVDASFPDRKPTEPLTTIKAPTGSSTAVVLDLTGQGTNLNRAVLSLRHALDAFGIPYRVTADFDDAVRAPEMLLVAGSLGALTADALTTLEAKLGAWLSAGENHCLWLFGDTKPGLLGSVGISELSRSTVHSDIIIDASQSLARYLDTPEEQDIYVPSLGDGTWYVPTVSYDVSKVAAPWHASVVGEYEDGSNSIVVAENESTGARLVVSGFSAEDFLFRMQYEKSEGHIRGDVNVFEPCADSVRLMLRAGYEAFTQQPFVRPFTSNGRKGAVLLTHDIDATVAYDILRDQFMPLERSLGLRSTLFVTTCYKDNGWIADLFTPGEHQGILRSALADGWTLQSHSVSHMPDTATWVEGDHITNPIDYSPQWNNATKTTAGSSLWAELAISAGELASCDNVTATGWRTGYLATPMTIGDLLERTGYYVTSDVTSGTVGGSLPYPLIGDRSTQDNGAETAVLQIPFALSDHLIETQDPDVVANNWLDITRKNANNNVPTAILVHPTKLEYLPAYTAYLQAIAQDPDLWVTTLQDWYEWYREVGIRSEVPVNFTDATGADGGDVESDGAADAAQASPKVSSTISIAVGRVSDPSMRSRAVAP